MIHLYFMSTAALVVGMTAQLLSFVILARYLGLEPFGQLMTIIAVTGLGLQVCGLGAGEGMVRRVARDISDYAALLGHNIILTLSSGVLLTVVLSVGLHFVVTVSDDPWLNLGIMALFVVSNVVLYRWILLVEQIFIARWQIARANVVNVGFALLRAAVTVVGCIGFGSITLAEWVWWHTGAYALGSIACGLAIVRFGAPVWTVDRREVRLGFHFVTPWIFWSLRQNIDLIVLSFVTGPVVVGSYGVVKRIIETSLILVTSLNRLLYPKLSAAGKDGAAATLRMTIDYLPMTLFLALAAAGGLFLLSPFLPMLFGDAYEASVPTLSVMSWIVIVIAAQKAAYEALGAAELHAARANLYNLGSLIGVIIIGSLTAAYLLPGTIVGFYLAEALVGAALWALLISMSRKGYSQKTPAAGAERVTGT